MILDIVAQVSLSLIFSFFPGTCFSTSMCAKCRDQNESLFLPASTPRANGYTGRAVVPEPGGCAEKEVCSQARRSTENGSCWEVGEVRPELGLDGPFAPCHGLGLFPKDSGGCNGIT